MFNKPSLKSAESNVETFKDAVQLSGFVTAGEDMTKAVEVAHSVQGVTSVKMTYELMANSKSARLN